MKIVHAVDDVSFEVFKGEVVGIVGQIRLQKSTLGKIVAGILPPTKGRFILTAPTNPTMRLPTI